MEYEIDSETADRVNANNYDIIDMLMIIGGHDVVDDVDPPSQVTK